MKNEFELIPPQASTFAEEVDNLTLTMVGITVFFTVLIVVGIIILCIKYRAKVHPVPVPVHGSMTLELTWTIIPLLICMGLFWWGTTLFLKQMVPPEEGMQFYVTGKQWMWKIQHPTGHREINTLTIPVNTVVKLKMTSEDVIHDFYVPAFRTKNDAIPGYYTDLWFEATMTGTFDFYCAEYCGTEHSLMIGKVHVLEPDEYRDWLDAQGSVESLNVAGGRLFQKHRCDTCHKEEAAQLGPSLYGLHGSEVKLAGGKTKVFDREYFKRSLYAPSAELTEGYGTAMPSYKNSLTEEEIFQLFEYVKSLGASDEVAAATSGTEGSEDR